MFIRFIPLDGSGSPMAGDSVIVNTHNITSMSPSREGQGWKAHGLVLKFTSGESEWVYVAPLSATAEKLDERMIALSIALRADVTNNITTPFFKPDDDVWMPGDTV